MLGLLCLHPVSLDGANVFASTLTVCICVGSLVASQISGGTTHNTVPDQAAILVEMRAKEQGVFECLDLACVTE